MKKIILSFLLLSAFTANAAKDVTNSFLYEISGNGLAKSSYLFGTFHVMCPDDVKLGDNLKAKLNSADRIVFEIDFSNPMELIKMMGSTKMPGDTTLIMLLNIEKYNYVVPFLRDSFKIKPEEYNTSKPVLLAQHMMPYMMGCSNITGVEIEILKLVLGNKKSISGLETVDDQLEALASITLAEQAEELFNQLFNMDSTILELQQMVAAYKARNLEKLHSLMTENDEFTPEMDQALLVNRNEKWIPVMKEMMEESSNFFAVGAGHLAGEKGLVNLLKKQGYKVSLIEE